MKLTLFLWLFPLYCIGSSEAGQSENLERLLKSKRSRNPPLPRAWPELHVANEIPAVHVQPQDGLMEADRIVSLPGQPEGLDFEQYSGYVSVDADAGRALLYYFVESPQNSSSKPLLLWVNGGPGCSSLGYGALAEIGPFRVNSDGKTLFRNFFSWNNVANVIFLESPAGVGFSYSNTSSDYDRTGDKRTADDAYVFLVNWLERFPQYKSRQLFISGESYAGHYVPQLAYTILQNNKKTNHTINLKGIAIGNALLDDVSSEIGMIDYFWSHALISDETYEAIRKYCYSGGNYFQECELSRFQALVEKGPIDFYNIYAPLCHPNSPNRSTASVLNVDPCSAQYVDSYLNTVEVQLSLHAKPTTWNHCSDFNWTDSPVTVLPTIKNLMASGIGIWIYSGDIDGRVPVTASRYSINRMKLPIKNPWRPWYSNKEVGGYVVAYEGVTFVTIREAGHMVPKDQPERSLTMISSFLQGILPPSMP